MTTTPNFDTILERLRERQTEPRDDYAVGECWNCGATLTAADIEHGDCSGCRTSPFGDDEDCQLDEYGDY